MPLPDAHGSALINTYLASEEKTRWLTKLQQLPKKVLTPRQQADLELLLTGAFSPLNGFLSEADYDSVVNTYRLANGTLWPIPINLDINKSLAKEVEQHGHLVLLNEENHPLAVVEAQSLWQANKIHEARLVYGTDSCEHQGVRYLLQHTEDFYLGGRVLGLEPPKHYDFSELRHSPQQLRQQFLQRGFENVIAFQTRNPIHRAHYELTCLAAKQHQAALLLHPTVGPTQAGDIDYFTRVRCYQAVLPHYPEQTTLLSILPLAMRMAGPREAVWHAIIRQNYGCSHFIIGRNHAGPNNNGKHFYSDQAAVQFATNLQSELGIQLAAFNEVVYVKEKAHFLPIEQVSQTDSIESLSGSELRRRLNQNLAIPNWFSFPEVLEELKKTYPPRTKQGFTVLFTGLSAAGKSTLAKALASKLSELGERRISLLDGDKIRQHLSKELGFSSADRKTHVERIAYVAKEITKHRGIALCAPIAPSAAVRAEFRNLVRSQGGFIEVYVSTPLAVCEKRDPKGLYHAAKQGKIKQFTGIDASYEAPKHPDLSLDLSQLSIEQALSKLIIHLQTQGFI